MVPIGASTIRADLVKISRALVSKANNGGKLSNQFKLSNSVSPLAMMIVHNNISEPALLQAHNT